MNKAFIVVVSSLIIMAGLPYAWAAEKKTSAGKDVKQTYEHKYMSLYQACHDVCYSDYLTCVDKCKVNIVSCNKKCSSVDEVCINNCQSDSLRNAYNP